MNSENHLYFIDSSALITVNRYYPMRVFPDLWKYMDGLFKRKRIFSHEMVYNEIIPASGPKDDIGKLVSKYKPAFYSITNRQGQLVLEVLANFPRLIDVRAKKDEADPWIISLVIEKMEEETLLEKIRNLFWSVRKAKRVIQKFLRFVNIIK